LIVAVGGLITAVISVFKHFGERRDKIAETLTEVHAAQAGHRSLAVQELELSLRNQRSEINRLRSELDDCEGDRNRLRHLYVRAVEHPEDE
jgi:uncharacterized membrane-anchored protein